MRHEGERYLMRRFGGSLGRMDCEDVTAEVIVRLASRYAEERPNNLRAVYLQSCRNAAIDMLRSRACKPTHVHLDAISDLAATEREDDFEDLLARVDEVLANRMPATWAHALSLRFAGMTESEIAQEMQISLPAAKKRLCRGLRRLKAWLE